MFRKKCHPFTWVSTSCLYIQYQLLFCKLFWNHIVLNTLCSPAFSFNFYPLQMLLMRQHIACNNNRCHFIRYLFAHENLFEKEMDEKHSILSLCHNNANDQQFMSYSWNSIQINELHWGFFLLQKVDRHFSYS